MPRVPPVTRTTAISGEPSRVGHPEPDQRLAFLHPFAVGGQPADDLAGEGRADLGDPDPADEFADVDRRDGPGSEPPSVPGSRPVPGACRDDSGLKMPLDGLTTTRSDM